MDSKENSPEAKMEFSQPHSKVDLTKRSISLYFYQILQIFVIAT